MIGRAFLCALITLSAVPAAAEPSMPSLPYGIGSPVSPEEIARLDIDVRPDGTGLPAGSGTVRQGAALYAEACAGCHGDDGRVKTWGPLVGRFPGDAFPFAEDREEQRTIGNYWPYATTLFDYINRAMPADRPGSLEPNEVYALTAYLLFLNHIVGEGTALDAETLPRVVMPARDRFRADERYLERRRSADD